MSVELTYPHVEKRPGEPARLQRVPRVRIAQLVMDQLAHGWSAEEMCRQYPYLKPAEAYSALAYYFDHKDEIDEEIRQEWAEADKVRAQAQPTSLVLRLRAKGLL